MTAYQAAIRIQSLRERAKALTTVIDSFESKAHCRYLIALRNQLEAEIDELADKLCAIMI